MAIEGREQPITCGLVQYRRCQCTIDKVLHCLHLNLLLLLLLLFDDVLWCCLGAASDRLSLGCASDLTRSPI